MLQNNFGIYRADNRLNVPGEQCGIPKYLCIDWSQGVVAVFAGTIFAGAGMLYYYEHNPAAIVLTAIGCLSPALCFRIYCMKQNSDLAQVTNNIALRELLASNAKDELLLHQGDFQNSQTQLQSEVMQEKIQNTLLAAQFEKTLTTLKNLTAQLQEQQTKYSHLEELYDQIKTTLVHASDKITALNQERLKLKEQELLLKADLNDLDKVEQGLVHASDKMDSNAASFEVENRELSSLIQEFDTKISRLEATVTRINEENAHLENLVKQVKILDESDDKFQDGTQRLEQLIKDLTMQNQELMKRLENNK